MGFLGFFRMRRASPYVTLLTLLLLGCGWTDIAARRTEDGSEEWGYVEVRPSKVPPKMIQNR